MDTQSLINLSLIVGLVLVVINAMITREILLWMPSRTRQAAFLVAVWALPVVGALMAYLSDDLRFSRKTSDSSNESSSVAGGLLGLESFFNPGARHTLETMQEQQVETRRANEVTDDADSEPAPQKGRSKSQP